MLLVIHNLPATMRYAEVKELIREKCGLTELILDNLINEGNGKRVTVGLADEGDATLLVKKINGLFLNGTQLYVEDVRQKKQPEPPYQPPQQKWQQPPKAPQPPKDMPYQPKPPMPTPPQMQPGYNMPYYMAQAQSTQVNYDPMAAMSTNPPQPFMYYQDMTGYMYQQPGAQNLWNKQMNVAYPDKSTLANVAPTMTDNRMPQNTQDRKRDTGKDDRNFPGGQESNWNKKEEFEPYKGNKDFSSRGNERYDNTNFRSNALKEQEDKYRYEKQSSPRSRDRYDNRSTNKGEGDYQRSSRRSRFDPSPPRNRSPRREPSPPRDRFRGRQSPERGSNYGFNEQEQQSSYRRREPPRDLGSYDHHRGFDDTERKNDRQGSFGSKRPYPNTSSKPMTYGNNPDNSTFSKSNANIFHQGPKKGFDMQNKKREINQSGPPAKVARFGQPGGNGGMPRGNQSGMNLPNANIPKNAPPQSMNAKLMKHSNWREHAAGILAGKVIANANVGKIKNYKEVLQNLRKCITSRLDVILGDQLVTSLNEMMEIYRLKFSVDDDAGFYQAVLEKLERDNKETRNVPGPGKKAGKNFNSTLKAPQSQQFNANPMANKPMQRPAKQKKQPNAPKQNQNQNKNVPPQQPQSGRLPKYPEASKQVYKDQKKLQKMEFQEEPPYTLEPDLRNALDTEMDGLCSAFTSACGESTDRDEEAIRQKILKHTVKEFRKVVRLHLTKRLLDVRTNLIVRIFAVPKPPKRDDMDAFLKSVGAVNLKKSDRKKMFLATCDSYESYDKLIAMKSTKIGDSEVSFKPLHLIGPPEKKNNKSKKNNPNQPTEDDEIHTDEDLDEEEINDNDNDNVETHDDFKQDVGNNDDFKQDVGINDDFKQDVGINDDFKQDVGINDNFNDDVEINDDEFVALDVTGAKKVDLNLSQDVVLVENKNEAVVVEDSDHKDEKTKNTGELKNNDANNDDAKTNDEVVNSVDEVAEDFADDDLEDF